MTGVGLYNRYWTTVGGAETYGAAMAQVLARSRDVELLGPDLVDVADLAARLRLDLTGIGFRQVADRPGVVTAVSGEYDLFVNVSFLSIDRAAALESVYVVHFPGEMDSGLNLAQKLAVRTLGPMVRAQSVETVWGQGFYAREGGRPRHFWTDGDARITVKARADEDVDIRLVLARRRPRDMDPVEIRIDLDGRPAAQVTLAGGTSPLARRRGVPVVVTVPADPDTTDVELAIRCDTFVPADAHGVDDDRRLGVALTALHTGSRRRDRVAARLGSWFPVLYRLPADPDFLDSYDHVLCNSAFTRGWLQRRWNHDGEVLNPPVRMHEPGPKDPIILSVGRFFGSDSGHSKKQLELVDAFRRLLDHGVEGWTLHLVGGCGVADRDYLASVRAAAEELPVTFHVDAPGDELEDLYARASLYWHATGLGEDAEADPDRLEHFGIATVEAMSAGAVPVVIGVAGQLEIVTDGVDGLHFATLDELVDHSLALIADEPRRAELGRAASVRAQDFSLDRFAEKLDAILRT